MSRNNQYGIVMTTTDSQDEADRLAEGLVEQKLAACVQILNITSYYAWEGKIENSPEYLMLIKTNEGCYDDVEQFLTQHHSYDVPEIVQAPIQRGLPVYLQWIDENTR
ncbi:MAG: divalent-cation tolerance protein CutA [Chloroflexota bacterium]